MRRFACLLGLIGLIVAPSGARADTLDNQLAALRPIVTQWWADQGLTATRCDTVEFSRHDYGPNDGTWATTLEGTDLAHPQHPEMRIPVCHVVFAEKLTLQPPARVCTVALHEWGHVLGFDHSSDPTNIMYGGPLVGPPPVCAAWGATPHKGLPAPMNHGRHASKRHMRAVMARY